MTLGGMPFFLQNRGAQRDSDNFDWKGINEMGLWNWFFGKVEKTQNDQAKEDFPRGEALPPKVPETDYQKPQTPRPPTEYIAPSVTRDGFPPARKSGEPVIQLITQGTEGRGSMARTVEITWDGYFFDEQYRASRRPAATRQYPWGKSIEISPKGKSAENFDNAIYDFASDREEYDRDIDVTDEDDEHEYFSEIALKKSGDKITVQYVYEASSANRPSSIGQIPEDICPEILKTGIPLNQMHVELTEARCSMTDSGKPKIRYTISVWIKGD